MRLLQYNFLKLIVLAVVSLSLFTGCDKNDSPSVATPAETLDQKITANSDLSLFQAALIRARLTVFTQGGGPFTIFAPTNAAFNAIGITSTANIDALDSNYLVQLLTYHIQAGSRTYVEIPLGPNANMVTQGGLTQYASRYLGAAPTAYINGAKITTADVKAKNGVMHIIDKVLIPPFNTNFTNLTTNPDYSLMVQAINKAAIVANFTATPTTVFAVPNSVMTAAGYDATTIAGLTGAPLTLLSNIMKYHVVPQRIFYPDFKAGTLKTSQGTNVTISLSGGNVMIKGTTNPSAFQVTSTGYTSSNGVLYSINGLLKY